MNGIMHGLPRIAVDVFDGGDHLAHGTAAEREGDGEPVLGHYRVQLFVRAGSRCIRETWSDPVTGVYQFPNIKYLKNGYFIILFDHGSDPKTAVVADYYTPDPMP